MSLNEISFPVDVSDLKNYLNDGGVVFFVVYINSNGSSQKIYYTDLSPIKLRILLSEAKDNITKNITLKEFPDDSNKKAEIFLNCYQNCQMQFSFKDAKLYTLEELEKQDLLEGITGTVSVFGSNKHDPQKAFLSNEVYLYAKIKGSTIPQPLELIPNILHTTTKIDVPISVNGILFYNSYTRICTKETTTLKIGDSLSVTFSEEKPQVKIHYQNSKMLRIRVKDLDFLLALLEAGKFEINKYQIQIDTTTLDCSNFDIDDQKESLLHHKKMLQMFDILDASNDFDLSKLTNQDRKNIDILIKAFVDKEPVSGFKDDLPLLNVLKIADCKFALALVHYEEKKDTYCIYDFFKTIYDVTCKDEEGKAWITSQFVGLKVTDYLEITNIDFNTLLSSYQRIPNNPYKYSHANMTLLNLLTAFDICKGNKPLLLSAASDFAEWLMKSNVDDLPYEIRSLNRLQALRRKREFTIDETKELCSITENSSSREDVLVGAYLLLGNQMAAKIHFEKLDLDMQKNFRLYPIYHFWTE